MKWYKNKLLKKLFLTTTDWNIAWKFEKDDTYTIIDNPKGYWLADGIIFKEEQNIYLFVEAYDKKSSIGKLGVLKFNGKKFTDFRIIMENSYHLSYPYVFKVAKKFYMIPETSENHTIELYEAIKFPHSWKKTKELIKGDYVDTTVYPLDDEHLKFFTYNENNRKYYSGLIKLTDFSIVFETEKEDIEHIYRSGGNVFKKGQKMYRAIQNNKFFYGQSLNIIDCNNDAIIKEILPNSIKNNKDIIYTRVHTYSTCGEIEIVDVSNYKFDIFKIIKKVIRNRG